MPRARSRSENDLKRFIPLLLKLLERAYGPREWNTRGNGVSVLIDTILSQNTSNKNSAAGFKQLRRRFTSWNQVANANVDDIERCIRVSGLSKQKAPRIQAILRQIKQERGKIDIQHLAEIDVDDATRYLTNFNGIGPKTAACVLLFAFGRGVFPVDTHIHRIARRLELVGAKASAEQTQQILQPLIPEKHRYALHVLLIAHGRKTCKAINPRCEACVLLDRCPFGNLRARETLTR